MEKKTAQAFKSVMDKIDGLKQQVGDGDWSDEQRTTYQSLLEQAEKIKGQADNEEKAAALKAWAEAPDGQSVVKQGWRYATDDEGIVDPGVSADKSSGEMFGLNGAGEEKLKTLKSGAYKDAIVEYIRATGMGRGMKSNAYKVLQEGSDTSGGFWVPPDNRAELIKKIATISSVRRNAFSFTTGSDIASFPKVTYTTDDKYTTGVRFGWSEEAPSSNITEATNPIAGRINIPVHTATAAIFITRNQLEDNQFDLLGYISEILSESFGLGEEDAFINGTGVGQPLGFLNHPNASVAHASGGMLVLSGASAALAWGAGTSGAATTTGILGIEAALPPQYEEAAKWFGNKAAYSAVRALTDSQVRPLWATMDTYPNYANGMLARLLGYPIEKSQFMEDISSTGRPLAFGDMKGYYIADRVGLSVEVFREVLGLRDLVAVYARKRVGGYLVHDWKLKLLKSNNS